MPNPVIGLQQLLAIKKAALWNASQACGVGDGIQFLSGQAKRNVTVQIDQSRGKAFSVDGTPGPIDGATSYSFNLRYAGFELLAAMLMGVAGIPAQQAATTAYLHTLKWSADPYGLFITIAKTMIAYIEEIPTAKVTGITLTGQVGPDPLQVTLDVIGINREIASAINTLGTFAGVTLPTDANANPVMFSQTIFRMNAQGGAALGSGDKIYPNKFTLSLKRKLKGEYTGQFRYGLSDMIDEPTNEDFPELKLTLEFPTHSATSYMIDLQTDSRKKMDITCTGALIASTYYYTHQWQMPHMQLLTANPTDEKGRIKEPLEFLLHGAVTAPTGMTGCTDPLWWLQTTKRTTNPLA